MKRSFLFALVLSVFAATALAQTAKTTEKSSFDKFYERLKISYFGAYQGSSIGHWDQYAIDEEGQKFKDYVHNVFNQVSFNYNFGGKMNFVFNPRWTLNTGSTHHHTAETRSVIVIEDVLTGFQGTLYSSSDKKFNFWTRIGARLPTSRTSRKNDVTFQPDMLNTFTYDFNPTWQLGTYLALRHWVYDERFTAYRYRVFVSPYIQYSLNDTTKLALWYENYSENRGNLKSQNGKDPNFKNYWETVMVSVGKDITPKFNFMPFLNYHINNPKGADKPLDNMGLGFWASYTIK